MTHRALHSTTVEPDAGPSLSESLAAPRWLLKAEDGPGGTRVFPLSCSVTVGRDPGCDLVLAHGSVSRVHARFEPAGERVRVVDLGSRNGLTVDGQRVAEVSLAAPSRVLLGSVPITLVSLDVPRPSHVVSGPGTAMERLHEQLSRVAPRDLSVLILGETGAGKERVARALHDGSARCRGPFHVVNCGAIPGNLLESFLFGHERGAFTGADRTRAGLFEDAAGGTVFLDEVAELSAQGQAALLRVLESRVVVRLGSLVERPVDVRVVAATHRPVAELVERGEFRVDLYHRLNAVTLTVPPLRERPGELRDLTQGLLRDAAARFRMAVPAVSEEVWQRFAAYAWPGNVRELRNVIERGLALCEGGRIELAHLPDHVLGDAPKPAARADGDAPLRNRLRDQELGQVQRALERCCGRKADAAASLGMPIRTFRRRLRELEKHGVGDPG